jgi:hypothetical protein
MVRPNVKFFSNDAMSPLCKGMYDHEYLSVMDLVVPFYLIEGFQ